MLLSLLKKPEFFTNFRILQHFFSRSTMQSKKQTILFSCKLLDSLVKLRKQNISFVTSICLSVCPHRKYRLLLYEVSWILYWKLVVNSVGKIQIWSKSDQKYRTFTWRSTHSYDDISLNSSWTRKSFGQNLYRTQKYIFDAK